MPGTGTPSDWVRPSWKTGVKWIVSMILMFVLGMSTYWGCDVMRGLK